MAELEEGYCTGCGYKVRRWGHRPFCWRKVSMMLDVDSTHKRRQRLLKEMNRHWRIRSLFLAKKQHMYFQHGDPPYPSEQRHQCHTGTHHES